MSCNRNDRDRVAGASDRNRNRDIKFTGTIKEEDFCRAVRRCQNDNQVAGVEDENRNNRCRNRGFWF
ncbi:MAG TPA: hypothetical protein VEV44_15770 [Pseudoneobacillus sp.]|nr:hypothetical protein [Pseudoneobacillus sp.]